MKSVGSVADLMDQLSDLLEKLEVVIPQEGLVLDLKKRRKIFVTSSYVVLVSLGRTPNILSYNHSQLCT